jgi:hypothetical protein
MSGNSVFGVAQHFELHQIVAVEQFARQTQRAHRIVGGVAAGGVRQQRVAVGGSTSSRLGCPGSCPILVRRIATVMICAPDASTASRVSSKSRYLPVPTSRRDEKILLPSLKVSLLI